MTLGCVPTPTASRAGEPETQMAVKLHARVNGCGPFFGECISNFHQALMEALGPHNVNNDQDRGTWMLESPTEYFDRTPSP